jgi:universal stress protein A
MQTPYQHLLIPVDFTEENERALEVAQHLAQPGATKVTLLHVIETIDYVADEEVEQFYKMLTQRAKSRLDEMVPRFRDAKIEVQGKVLMGKRARGIVGFVVQNQVDLVVLSSHRVNLNEPPKGLGTLSHQVSILSPCDVLLVK